MMCFGELVVFFEKSRSVFAVVQELKDVLLSVNFHFLMLTSARSVLL